MTAKLDGLRTGPAQVWGSVRLVPLIRDEPVPHLRLHRKVYQEPVSIVDVGDAYYVSFVPHAFVAAWSDGDQMPAASYGARLLERDAEEPPPRIAVRSVRRMARKTGKDRLRFLPLHLAVEGYLALHFGGPEIAWEEWARKTVAHGLSPRCEETYLGLQVRGLEDALRIRVAYLKLFRLSDAQVRRGYLLRKLAEHDWRLSATAAALGSDKAALVLRLERAGFGYLLRQDVLDHYRAQRRPT